MSLPTPEFKALVEDIIARYRPVLDALAAHDAGASDDEIRQILDRTTADR